MKILKTVLKKNRTAIVLWGIICAVNIAVSVLYGIMLEPALYTSALSLFFLAVFAAVDCVKEKKRSQERFFAMSSVAADRDVLPDADTAAEEDYQEMIRTLGRRLDELTAEYSEDRQDSLDYFTAWVHQIKTPIAVMKFKLSEETPENIVLRTELLRIEQYVEMVLQYIRLGSESNDLVICENDVDEMIRESLHKLAPQFVEKKLRLDYGPVRRSIVTDRKWFCCILDQILSNAVKYTYTGSVSIAMDGDLLVISDTGIGIAAEDLPRIFEKGYTGINGRLGERSSGLGLYLAGKAAKLLSIELSAQSKVGQGSIFFLDLAQSKAPKD